MSNDQVYKSKRNIGRRKYGKKLWCNTCGVYVGLANRAVPTQAICKPCHSAKRSAYNAAQAGNKPKEHAGAFLMVIKCRYSGELHKSNHVPEGFELVYAAPYGCLLPGKYHKLPAYTAL